MTSLSELPIDCQKTFGRYVRLLGCVGIKFFAVSKKGMIKEYVKFLLFNATFLPFVCQQVSLILKIDSDNFLEGSRSMPTVVVFVLAVAKMIIAITKRVQIGDILVEIGNLWPKDVDNNHEEKVLVLKDWLRQKGIIFNTQYIYTITTLVLYEATPLIATCYNVCNGVEDYIFPFELPESWKCDSIYMYIPMYICQVIGSAPVQLFLYLPFDYLMIFLTSVISLLFRLLQIDLENAIKVSDDAEQMRQLHISDNESYERIKTIIVIHQRLLRLADNMSNIFGVAIFIHIIVSSVLICFFGFLTVVYGGLAETFANLLAVFSSTMNIFVLSHAGQLLYDTSSNIAEAAYNSAWYRSDNRVRNLIKLIMIRAQRPCNLSALGYSDLTLRSFSKIMSTSWTYFTLLIQLYSES